MSDTSNSVKTKPTKLKVDLAFLLEKYGPKKKKAPKPVEEEPKYHENGFSVQFKLSHAFKALEQQEQDVAKPTITAKPKLTSRALRRLVAANASNTVIHPQTSEMSNNVGKDRLAADLEKYKRIGQMKREKSDLTLQLAKQKEQEQYLCEGDFQINKKHRVIPLQFWRSLSKRKGTDRDKIISEIEYDKTFITNANPDTVISTPKNKSHRKVRISNQVSYSSDKVNSNQTPRANKKSSPVFYGSKAVQEWEKRRRNRKQKVLDQKDKIKQAQVKGKSDTSKPSHVKSNSFENIKQQKPSKAIRVNSPILSKRHSSRKKRPKSAPLASNNNEASQFKFSSTLEQDCPKDYVQLSQWTKSLDTTFLDVPDKFEEPALKIPQPAKTSSNEDDEKEGEKENEEPELLYKPSRYLYDMCQCQKVSRLTTLKKLKEPSKSAGIIEIYGCSETNGKVSCPFCSVFPHKRILAWMEDVETQLSEDLI